VKDLHEKALEALHEAEVVRNAAIGLITPPEPLPEPPKADPSEIDTDEHPIPPPKRKRR